MRAPLRPWPPAAFLFIAFLYSSRAPQPAPVAGAGRSQRTQYTVTSRPRSPASPDHRTRPPGSLRTPRRSGTGVNHEGRAPLGHRFLHSRPRNRLGGADCNRRSREAGGSYFLSNGVPNRWDNGTTGGHTGDATLYADRYFSPGPSHANQFEFHIAIPRILSFRVGCEPQSEEDLPLRAYDGHLRPAGASALLSSSLAKRIRVSPTRWSKRPPCPVRRRAQTSPPSKTSGSPTHELSEVLCLEANRLFLQMAARG
jgi:hypothetical protein